MLNSLTYFESACKNNLFKIKGFLLRIFFKIHGCKVGKRLRCHNFPRFRVLPFHNYTIGDYVTIGYDITFEVQKDAKLKIGNYVKLTQGILISSSEAVIIGDNTIIGENTSIRDANHDFALHEFILNQGHTSSMISISEDVWIAAGCFILAGSIIPDGVVIGANSVVLAKSELKKNCIYAGSPVRFIRERSI